MTTQVCVCVYQCNEMCVVLTCCVCIVLIFLNVYAYCVIWCTLVVICDVFTLVLYIYIMTVYRVSGASNRSLC